MKKFFVSDEAANSSSQTIAEIVNVSGMESRDHSSNGVSSKNQRSRRNVLSLLCTAIALVFIFGACNKNDMENSLQPLQTTTMQNKMIPIAKLTDKNEIEHLFLQKDVQEFFSKENPNAKLVFMEVMDEEKNGKEVGLLYRIYYGESNITATSLTLVLTLEGGVYYYVPIGGGGYAVTTTCTTTECSSTTGCQPQSNNTCSTCPWPGAKCTRTTSSVRGSDLTELTDAIQYAVSVY